jgi:transforming growth factor-beta-induced protein
MKIKKALVISLASLCTSALYGQQSTVFEIIENSTSHTILEAAIIQEGLDPLLSDLESEFTVFAPDDDTFNAYLTTNGISADDLLSDPQLKELLLHHVIEQVILASDLPNSAVRTANGNVVNISKTNLTVDNNSIDPSLSDLEASNGVVHSLQGILLPSYENVADVAIKSDAHTTLVAALSQESDILEAIQAEGPFTVFAPTDDAFADLLVALETDAEGLLANQELLRSVLFHHVVAGEASSEQLVNGDLLALDGTSIDIDADLGTVDEANIINADIFTPNGVVHVIDAVLLPELGAGLYKSSELIEAIAYPNPANNFVTISGDFTSGKVQFF